MELNCGTIRGVRKKSILCTWYWCHFRGEGERRKEGRVVRRQEGKKEGVSPEGKSPKFGWS